MKVAFHWEGELLPDPPDWGPHVYFLRTLSECDLTAVHLKCSSGELRAWQRADDLGLSLDQVLARLYSSEPVWIALDVEQLPMHPFLLVVNGVSPWLRDDLHERFKGHPAYRGASQVIDQNPDHWVFFNQDMFPIFRVVRSRLRLFWRSFDPGTKHAWMEPIFNQCGFGQVLWEDMEDRHTIFDRYDNFGHSRRVAELAPYTSLQLASLAEDVVLRLDDIDGALSEELHAAVEEWGRANRASLYAHVATSARRTLEKLANILYPAEQQTKAERAAFRLDGQSWANRLAQYAKEHFEGTPKEVDGFAADVYRRARELANQEGKGVHGDWTQERTRVALASTLRLLSELLTLADPALETDFTRASAAAWADPWPNSPTEPDPSSGR